MKNINGQEMTNACLITGVSCQHKDGRFCVRCGHIKGWRIHTYNRCRVGAMRWRRRARKEGWK